MSTKNSFMDIRVQRADLLKELSAAQGAVERKATIPILSHLLLDASGNQIAITATDLNLSLRTACTAEVKKAGSCAIPARKFYDYVKALPDEEITLRVLENNWVEVRCGVPRTKMVGMPKDHFPQLPAFPADSAVSLSSSTLRTLIAKTQFAISNEESRYTLNGAMLLLKPEAFTMVATDGHRLAFVEMLSAKNVVSDAIRHLVPKKAIAEISSLLSNSDSETVEFGYDDNTLFFRIGKRLLTSRQLSGQFPNYDAVMPKDHKQCVQLPVTDFAHAIHRVSQFADERSRSIRLEFREKQLRIKSSSVETGESEDLLTTEYAGKTNILAFNSEYLSQFLRASGTDKVSFSFSTPDTAGELTPTENKDYTYRYIVMPMKV